MASAHRKTRTPWGDMKLFSVDAWEPSVQRFGGYLLSNLIRSWMSTLEYRAVVCDPTVDAIHEGFEGPVIYALWHEYIPIPFYLRAKTGFSILVSKHRDAEWLSQAAAIEGFRLFRGSSGRGGVGVLKAILKERDFPGFVVTPDGPRGPRREFSAGAVFMASKLGVPIVLVGLGYDRPWRNKRTWDQFAVPMPGSRARAILSDRIDVPGKMNRDELEAFRLKMQNELNRLTEEAERWATDNQPRIGSASIYKAPIHFSK
ncbi:MAG: DUF374 domain-containing protein [Planctomycetota bacterium]|nr:DUF374 domain-containing protein [Planctomycetota bacterium]